MLSIQLLPVNEAIFTTQQPAERFEILAAVLAPNAKNEFVRW